MLFLSECLAITAYERKQKTTYGVRGRNSKAQKNEGNGFFRAELLLLSIATMPGLRPIFSPFLYDPFNTIARLGSCERIKSHSIDVAIRTSWPHISTAKSKTANIDDNEDRRKCLSYSRFGLISIIQVMIRHEVRKYQLSMKNAVFNSAPMAFLNERRWRERRKFSRQHFHNLQTNMKVNKIKVVANDMERLPTRLTPNEKSRLCKNAQRESFKSTNFGRKL